MKATFGDWSCRPRRRRPVDPELSAANTARHSDILPGVSTFSPAKHSLSVRWFRCFNTSWAGPSQKQTVRVQLLQKEYKSPETEGAKCEQGCRNNHQQRSRYPDTQTVVKTHVSRYVGDKWGYTQVDECGEDAARGFEKNEKSRNTGMWPERGGFVSHNEIVDPHFNLRRTRLQ